MIDDPDKPLFDTPKLERQKIGTRVEGGCWWCLALWVLLVVVFAVVYGSLLIGDRWWT